MVAREGYVECVVGGGVDSTAWHRVVVAAGSRPTEGKCPMTTVATTMAVAPYSPARAWIAKRLFRHVVRRLAVSVVFPDGERIGLGGPEMRIVRPEAFFHRLGVDAKIGFGEAYMAGDWTSPDPATLLTPFAARIADLVPRPLQTLRRWVDAAHPD
jgi:hypothetical protein